jgi:hypothetical protein
MTKVAASTGIFAFGGSLSMSDAALIASLHY